VVYSHWSQHSLQASSHICQYRGAFNAPLPISRRAHSTEAYREKQHSNSKNFSAPLAIDSHFVHSAVANSCLYVNKRSLTEMCATLAFCFQIANSCTRWACNVKGLLQHGGRADFFKISALHSLMTTYRMNLISAGSISLGSTFKKMCRLLTSRKKCRISKTSNDF
jgi:hypothetical protein